MICEEMEDYSRHDRNFQKKKRTMMQHDLTQSSLYHSITIIENEHEINHKFRSKPTFPNWDDEFLPKKTDD